MPSSVSGDMPERRFGRRFLCRTGSARGPLCAIRRGRARSFSGACRTRCAAPRTALFSVRDAASFTHACTHDGRDRALCGVARGAWRALRACFTRPPAGAPRCVASRTWHAKSLPHFACLKKNVQTNQCIAHIGSRFGCTPARAARAANTVRANASAGCARHRCTDIGTRGGAARRGSAGRVALRAGGAISGTDFRRARRAGSVPATRPKRAKSARQKRRSRAPRGARSAAKIAPMRAPKTRKSNRLMCVGRVRREKK